MRKSAPLKILIGNLERDYRQRYFDKYKDRSAMKLTGRQRTRIKELLGIIPAPEIRRRLAKYFEDKSDWLHQRCHPWNVFVSNIDQYGGKNNGQEKSRYKPGDITERRNWIQDEIESYQSGKNR